MIYIVRHGQTDWNRNGITQGDIDIPLNETGRNQAKIVSDLIRDIHIDRIYSSDLLRARETAEIINSDYNYDIKIDKRLREFDYGDVEGIPDSLITDKMWDTIKNNPEKMHIESVLLVYYRIKDFFNSINLDEDILIVSHVGIMRVIMYYFDHKNSFDKELFDREYRYRPIVNGSIFKIDNKKI